MNLWFKARKAIIKADSIESFQFCEKERKTIVLTKSGKKYKTARSITEIAKALERKNQVVV